MRASLSSFFTAQNSLSLFACLLLGVIGAYAMAPAYIFPALFVALSGLYYFVARAPRPLTALWRGYAFGIGYFVCGLSWVGNAFEVEGNPFSWVMPIATIGLPMLLSVFPALAVYIARRFYNLEKVSGFLGFVALLALFDWLRGNIFSGFPWNLYGHAWGFALPVIQIISFSDVYFLTILSVLWCALPGLFLLAPREDKRKFILAACAIASFAACFAFGLWRLNAHPTQYRDDVWFDVVQPNIPQSEKWQRDKMVDAFYTHVQLSYADAPDAAKTVFIVWPETALTPWFANDRSSMRAIREALQSYAGHAYLLTGELRYFDEDQTNHNSLTLIDDRGNSLQSYDKTRLVPFGEFVPYQKWIPIRPVANFHGFVAGNGPTTYKTPEGISYSPLVCYEVIFPGKVVDYSQPRPDFIVNVTNDAWYGDSAGPYQHFAQALFRAVEEGVPVVRAANTGVSGIIDPLGRVLKESEIFEETSLTSSLPKTIAATPKIPYLKDIFFWGFVFFLLAVRFLARN